MQKVEVVDYALDITAGQDPYRVLWLDQHLLAAGIRVCQWVISRDTPPREIANGTAEGSQG